MSGMTAISSQPTEGDSVSDDQYPEAFLLPERRPASSLVREPNAPLCRAALLACRSYCSRQEVPFNWVGDLNMLRSRRSTRQGALDERVKI